MNMLDFRRASLEGGPAARGRRRDPSSGHPLAPLGRDRRWRSHRLGIRPVDVELGLPDGEITIQGEVLLRGGWATTTAADRVRRRAAGR